MTRARTGCPPSFFFFFFFMLLFESAVCVCVLQLRLLRAHTQTPARLAGRLVTLAPPSVWLGEGGTRHGEVRVCVRTWKTGGGLQCHLKQHWKEEEVETNWGFLTVLSLFCFLYSLILSSLRLTQQSRKQCLLLHDRCRCALRGSLDVCEKKNWVTLAT